MTKLEAATAEIMEAIEANMPFLVPAFVSEQYGRAVCSTVFRQLDLGKFGYEKRGSVYFKVAA